MHLCKFKCTNFEIYFSFAIDDCKYLRQKKIDADAKKMPWERENIKFKKIRLRKGFNTIKINKGISFYR